MEKCKNELLGKAIADSKEKARVLTEAADAKLIQSGRLRFSDIYYFEGGSLSYCLLALLWVPTVNI